MRFIFPALSLLFVLCGVGTGDLVGLVSGSRQRTALWMATAAALTWCATSFYVANARQMIALWSRDGDWLAAMNLIAASPEACGVGLDPASEWHHTGQVHLRSDQLLFDGQQGFDRFNFILRADGAGSTPLPPSYRSIACYPGKDHVCVLARQGGCSSDSKAAPLTAEAGDTVVSILRRVGLLQP